MDDDAPSPLEPDQLDEVLSAELDGELDAVARDFGLGTAALAARLAVTPGVAERRAALTAARALLEQVADLDELAAARLRNAALLEAAREHTYRKATTHRRGGRLLAVAGAAAAIVAIGGLAVSIGHGDSSSKSSSGEAAPAIASAPSSVTNSAAAALGAFTDVRALAQSALTRDAATRKSTTQNDQAAAPTGNATTTEVPAPQTSAPSTKSAGSSDFATAGESTTAAPSVSGATAACAAPPEVPVSGRPALRAAATLNGAPVVVLVYVTARERVVVIEDLHCTLLNTQTFAG